MLNLAATLFLTLSLLLPGACTAAADAVETARTLLRKEQEALARTAEAVAEQRELLQRRSSSLAGDVQGCIASTGADCARAAEAVTPTIAEQARLDADAARVALESAELDLQASRHLKQELETAIGQLETTLQQTKAAATSGNPAPSERPLPEMEAALAEKRELVRIETDRQVTRQRARELAAERFALAREWSDTVADLLRKTREASQQNALESLLARLEQEQQLWLGRAARWRGELPAEAAADTGPTPGRALLQTRIDNAEERARLAQDRIRLAQIRARLDAVEAQRLDADSPSDELNRIHERVLALRRELAATQSLLAKRRNVTAQRVEVVERRPAGTERGEQLRLLRELDGALGEQFTATADLLAATAELPSALEEAYNRSFRRGLTARFSLPADVQGWYRLARELSALPAVFAGRITDSVREVGHGLGRFTVDRWLLVLLVLGFWYGVTARLRRLSARSNRSDAGADSFVRHLLQVPLALLERGGRTFTAVGSVAALLWLAAPPEPAQWILAAILAAWTATRIAVDLLWALLADPDAPPARRHPALYRQVRWMTFALGALAAITALAHSVGLSAEATNAIDRLFMLFLLLFTVPALETRRFALALIEPRLGERYWMRVIRLLSLLAPLAVLAAASVGVAGYLNLAWAIGKALASVLAVLALWLIAARLLREGVEALRRRAYRRGGSSTLLVTGLIDPLHTLARPLLFAALWTLPLHLYGIGWDTPPIAALNRLAQTPLTAVGGTNIHAFGVLITLLVGVAVVRVGRWMRLMTYRWAFARVTDLGIRHSLSVFTQYSFVLLGVLFTLRLIGFDLTSVAIFAGAIGVGLGFGLQNIANNFISGILLLVERPLRTADIVKIGEHEGEVTHIGMRSLTVKTWDNQEVIMPNSEVLSHAFTNWTHSDNTVRTVIRLGISYDSDPRAAKAAIEQVLAAHPALLRDPHPRVWLAGFGDSSVDFHVQYFVDVGRHSRPEVKSEVLFAIWDALRAAGVRIPYPQLDVTLRPAAAGSAEAVVRAVGPVEAAA